MTKIKNRVSITEATHSTLVVIWIGALASLALSLRIGRPRIIGGSYFLIGGAVVYTLLNARNLETARSVLYLSGYELKLSLIFLFLAVAVVSLGGPGILFYSLLAVVFCLGIVAAYQNRSLSPLLIIGLASFVSMYGQVVPFNFTAVTRDTVVHTIKISWLIETGRISSRFMPRYQRTPIYHLLVAEYGILTQLRPRFAAFLMTSIPFVSTVFPTLVFGRTLDLTPRERLTLLGVLLFSSSFIYHGYRVFPQSLSFVYLILILSVLFSRGTRRLPAFVLCSVCLVLTNSLGAIIGLSIVSLVLLSISGWDIYGILQLTILAMTLLYYWVSNSIVELALFYLLQVSSAAKGVESLLYVIDVKVRLINQLASGLKFGLNLADLSILVALFISGCLYLLYSGRKRYLIVTCFSALFFFPNPIWFVIRGLVLTSRWKLMILPLVLIPIAVAISKSRIPVTRVGVAMIFLLAFTSVSLATSQPSLTDFAGYDKEKQHSISRQEIATIRFITENARTAVYSRRMVFDYLSYTDLVSNHRYAARLISIRSIGGKLERNRGLTIVPSHAIAHSAARMKVESASSAQNVTVSDLISSNEVHIPAGTWNKVYGNGNNEALFRSTQIPDG